MKKLGFIFPGQGSQKVGMGKEFYENFDVAKEMFKEASDAIGVDFTKLLFEENENLGKTEFTQPAILLVSAIAHKLFENEVPMKPSFALGHSLGEFSALVSVGALSLSDAIYIVHNRGKFMNEACVGGGAGMMVTLGLADEAVEEITQKARAEGKKVWSANYNTDGQIVVAGLKEDLSSLQDTFKGAGAKRAMLLDMSVASHCPLLKSAVEPLVQILDERLKDNFLAPVISNVTAKAYNTKSEALDLLGKQLISPVKYKQSIAENDTEVDLFIEFGGAVLKGMNKKITKVPTIAVSNPVDLEATFEGIK